MIAMNAAVASRTRVVEDRLFDDMVLSILSALWECRAPEDVDLAGLGFDPDRIARQFDAAAAEARRRYTAARAS